MIGLLLGSWQRVAIYASLAALLLGMAELDGYRRGEKKLYEYQAEQANAAVAIVTKRGAVTEKVITKYVKVAGKTQVVTNTIEKEVLKYANAGTCLDDDWRMLHDAAANNLPETSGDPDAVVLQAGAHAASLGDDSR